MNVSYKLLPIPLPLVNRNWLRKYPPPPFPGPIKNIKQAVEFIFTDNLERTDRFFRFCFEI